jgi:hypothetical protein
VRDDVLRGFFGEAIVKVFGSEVVECESMRRASTHNDVRLLRFPCWLIAAMLTLATVSSAVAQEMADSSRRSPQDPFEFPTTFEGWAERHLRLVLDRRHNIGSRLYDRGVFRHVTPEMNRNFFSVR